MREQALQLEILGPRSIGGLNHGGWDSCMESMSMGVPILAWPMHWDHPSNRILVTRILEIGLVVEWSAL